MLNQISDTYMYTACIYSMYIQYVYTRYIRAVYMLFPILTHRLVLHARDLGLGMSKEGEVVKANGQEVHCLKL